MGVCELMYMEEGRLTFPPCVLLPGDAAWAAVRKDVAASFRCFRGSMQLDLSWDREELARGGKGWFTK